MNGKITFVQNKNNCIVQEINTKGDCSMTIKMNNIKDYDIYIATMDDADAILNLLKETALLVSEKHPEQWDTVIAGEDDKEILNGIRNHETFMIKDHDGKLIATFTLYDHQNEWDKGLWGIREDNAAYLHKIAIHPNYTGGGLGKEIIDWIIEYLTRKGKEIFRLDCVEDNEKLNEFYGKKCGLTKVGANKGYSLYEKHLK